MSNSKHVVVRPKLLSASVAAALGTAASAALIAPLHAQETPDQITVTGSRIVQRDFTANSPIVSVESDLFEGTSTVAVETVLNQLPQFVPAVTQFTTTNVQPSSTVTTGANTISLRGLGANRNLVLLDGRRAQPVNALLTVDTNTIPSAAIERVEVVTGGASATYGADAISGVVNFILKKDFEGLELDVQTGQTFEGDGDETRLAGLFGANFDDGRGNVMLGLEVAQRDVARQFGREFFDARLTDPTMTGTNTFSTNTYYLGAGNNPSQAVINGLFDQAAPGSVPGNASFYFNRSDGTVYAGDDPDGAYRYNDGLLGGLRKIRDDGTIDENQPFSIVSTPLERFSLFGRGRYELGDNVEIYTQGNFVQTETKTAQQYSPAVTQWNASIPYGPGIYAPSLLGNGNTNPEYMAGGSRGLNCGPVGGCTNSEAFPVPAELAQLLNSRPTPDANWNLNRTQDYLGAPRSTQNKSQMFQLLAGVTGGMAAIDGSWDVYVSHGETDTAQHLIGFGDLQNYRNVVQQANYGRGAFALAPAVNSPNSGSGGTAFCTTGLPIFEEFAPSEDCLLAVTANITDQMFIAQDIIEGTVQGRIAELPAGDLRFAAGASYRENEIDFEPSHLNSFNNSASQVIGLFASRPAGGETSATDVFGEIALPIIARDSGIVKDFGLELGTRWSDYDLQGQSNTWKALFELGFNETVRLRGGWQRANRAPNVGELYAPQSTVAQATAYGDPCATNSTAPWGANAAANPNYLAAQAFCSQLMGAVGAAAWYANPQTGAFFPTATVVESGNPALRAEEADTVTFGVVLAFQSVDIAIDWYQIEINDLIGLTDYDTVYEQCLSPAFNAAQDPNNPFCRLITRDPETGGQQRTRVSRENLGFYKTSGVDLQVTWSTEIGENSTFGVNMLTNFLHQYKTQDLPSSPLLDSTGTGADGGQFDYRVFTSVNYSVGPFRTALRWRHYPSIEHAQAQINPNTTTRGADSYDIFDLTGLFTFDERYELRFGIDNLLDTEPNIYGATPTSSGAGLTLSNYYDVLGRRAYVGFKVEF